MDDLTQCMARNPERFDQLLEEIRVAGTDHLVHFGNRYTHEGGLSLQQNPFEFAAAVMFLEDALHGDLDYLEIGSGSGGTCRFLMKHLPFWRAWVIDNHGHGRWTEQQANFDAIGSRLSNVEIGRSQRHTPVVQKWVGDSHSKEAKTWLHKNLLTLPALSFIDGDHTYEGCWADFEMVHSLLSGSNRLVMFHDTVACEGVKQAWQRAISNSMLEPLAEYIGPDYRPLGIGIGRVK